MRDDNSNRGMAERRRIDINDENVVRNWCKSPGVTPDQLKSVVKVGPMVDEFSEALRGGKASERVSRP